MNKLLQTERSVWYYKPEATQWYFRGEGFRPTIQMIMFCVVAFASSDEFQDYNPRFALRTKRNWREMGEIGIKWIILAHLVFDLLMIHD